MSIAVGTGVWPQTVPGSSQTFRSPIIRRGSVAGSRSMNAAVALACRSKDSVLVSPLAYQWAENTWTDLVHVASAHTGARTTHIVSAGFGLSEVSSWSHSGGPAN